MNSHLKTIVLNSLLFCCSLVIGACFVEVALRLLFVKSLFLPALHHVTLLRPPHPVLGWALAPNSSVLTQTLDYTVTMRTNSHGLRDREHTYEPAPGTFRILLLGDSLMEAQQVDLEQSLPRLLERRLADRNVEVINGGVASYGCGQEYLFLREEGLKYKPNLVLQAFYGENDVRNDCREMETIIWGPEYFVSWGRPYPDWDTPSNRLVFDMPDFGKLQEDFEVRKRRYAAEERAKWWFESTVTYSLVSRTCQTWHQQFTYPKTDPNVCFAAFLTEYDPASFPGSRLSAAAYADLWNSAWRMTTRLLTATRDLAQEHHAQYAVFTVPAQIQSDPAYLVAIRKLYPRLRFDVTKTDLLLEQVGKERGFPVLNLTPTFQAICADRGISLSCRLSDRHWNAAAHQLAAETLAQRIEAQGLLPPGK